MKNYPEFQAMLSANYHKDSAAKGWLRPKPKGFIARLLFSWWYLFR